jgi:hypothetical protein
MPAPNLLDRCRPTGEQISIMQYSHNHPWNKQHSPLDRLTPRTTKRKKLNNKQGTEKEHAAERVGCSEHTGEGRRGKELISTGTFSKQTGKAEGLTAS